MKTSANTTPDRNTPLGILHRAICIYTPRAAYRVDARLTGGRISKGASRAGHYLLYKRHPLVLVRVLSNALKQFMTLTEAAADLLSHTLDLSLRALPSHGMASPIHHTPLYHTAPLSDSLPCDIPLRKQHRKRYHKALTWSAAARIPLRSHSVPPAHGLLNMRRRKARTQQALQPLRRVRRAR